MVAMEFILFAKKESELTRRKNEFLRKEEKAKKKKKQKKETKEQDFTTSYIARTNQC